MWQLGIPRLDFHEKKNQTPHNVEKGQSSSGNVGIDDCQIIRDIVGKTSQFEIVPESEIEAPYLCLLHHMIDVAAVAIKMWELGLSQEQKKNLATLFTPPHEQYSSSAVETDSDGGRRCSYPEYHARWRRHYRFTGLAMVAITRDEE